MYFSIFIFHAFQKFSAIECDDRTFRSYKNVKIRAQFKIQFPTITILKEKKNAVSIS